MTTPQPRSVPPLRRALAGALLAGAALSLTSAPALAGDLYVGGPDGVIQKGDPVTGGFQFLGLCGGPIQSIALDGADLFVGDSTGNIYHYDAALDFVNYAFTVPNDARALLIQGGDLLVGGSDATLLRVDKSDGTILDTLDVGGISVDALLMRKGKLYVGSSFGVVMRGAPDGSAPFEFWGTCGGPVTGMSVDGGFLMLSTSHGSVYRLDLQTQAVVSTWFVGNDATASVMHAGDLLVAGSDASVLRLDPANGAGGQTLDAQFEIRAMTMSEDQPVGATYCYGTVCPCGNDDARAGCANSTGDGAKLTGIGSDSIAADDLLLVTQGMPPGKWGILYMGPEAAQTPFGDGQLCAGTGDYGIFRFKGRSAGANGSSFTGPGLVQYSQEHFTAGGQILPGVTWHFQVWYRDAAGPCSNGFNTTNACAVTFLP